MSADTDRMDETPTDANLDLAHWAWTIIANVSEGNWDNQTEEWQAAVVKWRETFHARLMHITNPDQSDGSGGAT